jgi:hydroxymethylpyrimidine/phosphomethylpyrimidine kinase
VCKDAKGQAVQGRVLIIAGSDSGGGAGIQADIKTVTALGGYSATAVTVQNTQGVSGVHPVPADIVAAQVSAVLSDIGADVIKIGMLNDQATIEAVASALESDAAGIPIVLDPVMIAKGGHALLVEAAVDTLKQRLVPLAAVLTPNIPEAEALTGESIDDVETMERAARRLSEQGADAVMLKGGHMPGDKITDVLFDGDGNSEFFSESRIDTPHTHGTGCTLASGVATGLAQQLPLRDAVIRARAYVRKAIETAPGFGAGHGPLNHGHTVTPFYE